MTPTLAASFRRLLASPRDLAVVAFLAAVSVFVLGSWAFLRVESRNFVERRVAEIAARPIPAAPAYRWGEVVRPGVAMDHFHDGWSRRESWGVWNEGPRARIAFAPVEPTGGDVRVRVVARGAVRGPGRTQEVEVRVGGETVGHWSFDRDNVLVERTATLPARLVAGVSPLVIELAIADPVAPLEKRQFADTRRLGIGIAEIVLTPAE